MLLSQFSTSEYSLGHFQEILGFYAFLVLQ